MDNPEIIEGNTPGPNVVRFDFENIGIEKFVGSSNLLFTEDFINNQDLVIEFSDSGPKINPSEYEIAQWKSVLPFKAGVRIAEFNEPSDLKYHMPSFNLSFIEACYDLLSKLIRKYRNYNAPVKQSGLVWKYKVKRA